MAGPDRAVGVLRLFTLEKPAWTVEETAKALGVSVSSAYRYVATLSEAGFLTPASTGRYMLGPAFIQYDRQIQLTDPLLRAAEPIMGELVAYAPDGTTLVLCRVFGDVVLCVHQVLGRGPQPLVSYQRGRPMPLFRGATSKIILAYLQPHHLRRLHAEQGDEIEAAGLGADFPSFKQALAVLRKAGHAVTRHELDPGRVGIAAPILGADRRVLGSLSFIVAEAKLDKRLQDSLTALVVGGAHDIEAALDETPATVEAARREA
jgi:DNA-binding IclR family transcriptional regulator